MCSVLSCEGGYTNKTLADQLSATADTKKRKKWSSSSSTIGQLEKSLCPGLWISHRRRVRSTGLPHYSWGIGFLPTQGHTFWDAFALCVAGLFKTHWLLAPMSILSVEHALSCLKGATLWYIIMRSGISPPTWWQFLNDASSVIQDHARLDVGVDGFWGSRFEWAFFDIRVFNPTSPLTWDHHYKLAIRTMKMSKRNVWSTNQKDRIWDLLSTGFLVCWWYGPSSCSNLQEACFPSCRTNRWALQYNNGLQTFLLTPS